MVAQKTYNFAAASSRGRIAIYSMGKATVWWQHWSPPYCRSESAAWVGQKGKIARPEAVFKKLATQAVTNCRALQPREQEVGVEPEDFIYS